MTKNSWSVLCAGASLALAASALALPAASAGARPPPEFTNLILGTNRPDVLVGGSGRDLIEGRGGADVLYGRARTDRLEGGSGNDVLRLGPGRYQEPPSVNWAAIDRGFGGPGDDRIFGGPGPDDLYGDDGNDRLYSGGRGHEVTIGGQPFTRSTWLWGGRGADVLVSSSEGSPEAALVIDGGPGPDRLIGSAISEAAVPGNGIDVAWLGGGDDRIFAAMDGQPDRIDCGAGVDSIYTTSPTGDGVDPQDVFIDCEYIDNETVPTT